MKAAYPVIFRENKKDKVPYYVYIPDFDISTQGMDIADSIEMARDAIQLAMVTLEDGKQEIPSPNSGEYETNPKDIISYVDVDSTRYRAALRNLSVKKNCTIPQWLAEKAEKAGINFSRTLQDALMAKLDELSVA